ncbi:ABC transporter substrate-binding protein [Paracoccus sp. Ld10]|uniref:ABC transporter substrate-binding protein n=1 Tax=Paracoccus sp. Ld10 TaxID=649158 RepID=UPI003864828A
MIRWLIGLALIASPAWADAPARVVSINLCTDQLAMLVAAPGQLASVSYLARDPYSSAMAEEAATYPTNRGQAEDLLTLRPDLVLAGPYSSPATVAMLDRLGLRVATFDMGTDLDSIRTNLQRMGDVLGQRDRADRIMAQFDRDLAALQADLRPERRAALYGANGYSSGQDSLAAAILAAAGLSNVAADLGLPQGGFVPLEDLVMADPDLIVTSRRQPRASRAEEVMDHPVLRAITPGRQVVTASDRDWACGTPHVLRAVAQLRQVAP